MVKIQRLRQVCGKARLPRPPVTPGLVGEWVLFAAQRAPGGLSADELEESYCDEYILAFPFEHEDVRLHLHEDGRVNLKLNEFDYEGHWDATADGFAWRAQNPDGERVLELVPQPQYRELPQRCFPPASTLLPWSSPDRVNQIGRRGS